MESERTTRQTSPTLRDGSCRRNLKNDISDVNFIYFYSDYRKVPRIKSDVFIPGLLQHCTTTEQLMYTTLDFLVVLNARRFIVGASMELKFRTTDKADTAHVVSELPKARKP